MFGLGKKYPYIVTLLHSGHHPYMADPTYDMFEGLKQERVRVMARNLSHAEDVAHRQSKVRSWTRTMLSVGPENAGDSLLPGRKADHYKCGQR